MQSSLLQKNFRFPINILCKFYSVSAIFSVKSKIRKNSQCKIIAFFGCI